MACREGAHHAAQLDRPHEGTEVDFLLAPGGVIPQPDGSLGPFVPPQGVERVRVFTRAWIRSLAPPACSWRRASAGEALAEHDAGLRFASGQADGGAEEAKEAATWAQSEKHGIPLGHSLSIHTNVSRVPIWVANYILMDIRHRRYHERAGHDARDFEFAHKYAIHIRRVDCAGRPAAEETPIAIPYEDGVLINSANRRAKLRSRARKTATGRRERVSVRRRLPIGSRLGRGAGSVTGARRFPWSTARRTARATPDPVPDEQLPVLLAGEDRDHATGRLAAQPRAGVSQHYLSKVWRAGAPRNRHHGHVCRFEWYSIDTPMRKIPARRSAQRSCATGFPSTSTSAAWSTPSCT